MALGCIVLVGCGKEGTPGGPGATSSRTGSKVPFTGETENSFRLDMPSSLLPTSMKQGEQKVVKIGINRGTNFDQDVMLKFGEMPKGVTIDPASPVIKHGDKDVQITIKAADDAALGDFTIKVTGHPAKGADAMADLKIKVDKK